MFKTVLSVYITSNMAARGWKLKDLARESGLSDSTLNSYIKQKSDNPAEVNLARIAAAFGDQPEVIKRMQAESVDVTAAAKQMSSEADDAERMEKFTAIVKSSMLAIMQEYLTATASQQTELIQHADARVAEEQRRAQDLNAKVLAQCEGEVERAQARCNKDLSQQRAHHAELLSLHDKHLDTLRAEHEKTCRYLHSVNKSLSIALIAVSLLAVIGLSVLGGYSVYAYHTFDRQDPTRGLYQSLDK